MSASVINMEDLAGVKRHAVWAAGYSAPVQQPQPDTSQFTDLLDLAKVKLSIERHAA